MNYINFNNAGSSQTFPSVNKNIIKFLRAEEKYGGYYSANLYSDKLNEFYFNLSKLINCKKSEISFIANTTLGFNLFIQSIKNIKDINVIIFSNEYESNLICLRNNKVKFRTVKIDENGDFNINDLISKIDKKTLIVNLCHITSNIGNENPAYEIGKIIKKIKPDIIYSIDACQSIGHLSVDVKRLRCDILIGSGRKFLRGPRGTGFIYLRKDMQNFIKPNIVDNHNIIDKDMSLRENHIFENFEYSPALKIGLSESIKRINNIGIKKIEKNVKIKSLYLRNNLKKKIKYFFL